MTKRKTAPKLKPKSKAGRPQNSASATGSDDAKDLLLSSAIKLFAKKGFDGTSVKNIANQAGVNISLVSYHFGGKEGLYKTCLERFGRNRLAATQRILQPSQTREECLLRLDMFIEDMLVWFDEEPDLCAMVQRESDMGFRVARDVFEGTFLKVFMTLMEFVKAGQTRGFLRSDFDPQLAASLFFTGLIHMIQKDDITKRTFGVTLSDLSYRKKFKSQVCAIFFNGLASVKAPLKPVPRSQGAKK